MEYTTPQFAELGSLAALTLGQGGSSLDGLCTDNQKGGGNNGVNGTSGGTCR